MKEVQIVVNGEKISVDVDGLLQIVDVNVDMNEVAALMGYWASINAAAEREKVQADSYYRQWRAEAGKKLLAAEPKLPEWKVKQEIEASKAFLKLKSALAEATRCVTISRGLYDALRIKANMLQSKGAMERAGLERSEMSTPVVAKKKKTKRLEDHARKTFTKKK